MVTVYQLVDLLRYTISTRLRLLVRLPGSTPFQSLVVDARHKPCEQGGSGAQAKGKPAAQLYCRDPLTLQATQSGAKFRGGTGSTRV